MLFPQHLYSSVLLYIQIVTKGEDFFPLNPTSFPINALELFRNTGNLPRDSNSKRIFRCDPEHEVAFYLQAMRSLEREIKTLESTV
jgi:hypothetical protein